MALVRMGANVQCNGYFRDFHSVRDLFLGSEGSGWNICNDNSRLRSSNQHNHSLSSLPPDFLLGHKKEVFKQTMLQHEAIFRGQIEELHRLYWRQKTLMEELTPNGERRQIVRERPLQSSSFFSYAPYKNIQKSCHSLEFPSSKTGSHSLASHALNTQSISDFVQRGHACGTPISTEGFPQETKLLEHKYKKVGKKILDLHLPACEYIDSDEEEYSEERKIRRVFVVPFNEGKPSPRNNSPDSSLCKHNFGPGTSLRSSTGFTDLNEPINTEEEELAPRSDDLLDPMNPENGPSDDSSRTVLGSHISPKNLVPNTKAGQDIEACTSNPSPGSKDMKCKHLSSTNEAARKDLNLESWDGKMTSAVDISTSHALNIAALVSAPHQIDAKADVIVSSSSRHDSISEASDCAPERYSQVFELVTISDDLDLNVIPDGCLPETPATHDNNNTSVWEKKCDDLRRVMPWFNENPIAKGKLIEGMSMSLPETKESRDSKKEGEANLSRSVIPASKAGKDIHSDEILLNSGNRKDIEPAIDLNSYASEDGFALEDTDLQAPVSPENKESSPPRGESDGNQHESYDQLPTREDVGQREEAKMAARVLVSISTCWIEKCFHTTAGWDECKSLSDDSLYWFAGIIDRVQDDPEDNSKVVLSDKAGDTERRLPNAIDDYEAMTLELRETEVEDCLCVTNNLKDKETGLTSSPFQARKSRTRRGRQRRDFQRDVLPGLASLSRYEVTEDLQLIGGLIEAAGPGMERTFLRSLSRTGLSRGRKRSASSIMNHSALDSMTGVLTSSNNELSIEKRCLIGWGNITRKRRGQRYSAKPILEPSI